MNRNKTRYSSLRRGKNFAFTGGFNSSDSSGSVTDDIVSGFSPIITGSGLGASILGGALKGRNPNNPLVPVVNLGAAALPIANFLVGVAQDKGEGITGKTVNLGANLLLQLGAYKAAEAAARKLSKNQEPVATSPSVYAPQGAQVTYQSPDNTVYGGRSYYSRPRHLTYNFAFTGGFGGGSGSSTSSGSSTGSTGTGSGTPAPTGSGNLDLWVEGVNVGSLTPEMAARGLGRIYNQRTGGGLELNRDKATDFYLQHPSLAKRMMPKGSQGRLIKDLTISAAPYMDAVDLAKLTDATVRGHEAREKAMSAIGPNFVSLKDPRSWLMPWTDTYKKRQSQVALRDAAQRLAEDRAYRAEDTLYDIQSGRYNNTIPDILEDLGRGLKTGIPSVVEGLQGIYGGEKSTGNWATRNREGLLTLGGLGGLGLLGLLGYGLYRGRQRDNMMRGYYPY